MGWHWPSHFEDGNRGSFAGLDVVEVHCSAENQDRNLVEVSGSGNLGACPALDVETCPCYPLLVEVSSMVSRSWFDIQDC